jgi:hypothetical protein
MSHIGGAKYDKAKSDSGCPEHGFEPASFLSESHFAI